MTKFLLHGITGIRISQYQLYVTKDNVCGKNCHDFQTFIAILPY